MSPVCELLQLLTLALIETRDRETRDSDEVDCRRRGKKRERKTTKQSTGHERGTQFGCFAKQIPAQTWRPICSSLGLVCVITTAAAETLDDVQATEEKREEEDDDDRRESCLAAKGKRERCV